MKLRDLNKLEQIHVNAMLATHGYCLYFDDTPVPTKYRDTRKTYKTYLGRGNYTHIFYQKTDAGQFPQLWSAIKLLVWSAGLVSSGQTFLEFADGTVGEGLGDKYVWCKMDWRSLTDLGMSATDLAEFDELFSYLSFTDD